MWGEKREGEGNQTPKFPFSIKRKISKNLGLSSKVYNFFDFCVRMIRAPFVGLIKWKFIHLIRAVEHRDNHGVSHGSKDCYFNVTPANVRKSIVISEGQDGILPGKPYLCAA